MTLLCLWLLNIPAKASALPEDQSSAVILAYHRINEDAFPGSTLRLEQFITHIEDIKAGHYTVKPLPELIRALKKQTPLPPKTLAITFEGAHRSALDLAMPHLLKNNIPFTIVYSAGKADQNIETYMNWEQLKTLSQNPLVTLATLPYDYGNIVYEDETNILKSINKARQKHRTHFGAEAGIFSYPFGLITSRFKTLAEQQGYKAALSLNSGAAHMNSHPFTLPRFAMTESFGDRERFQMITQSLPFPVTDFEPSNEQLANAPFNAGFTLPEQITTKPQCFLSGHPIPDIEKIGRRIEIRLQNAVLTENRIRLNCTLEKRNKTKKKTIRWLGKLFHQNRLEDTQKQPIPPPP